MGELWPVGRQHTALCDSFHLHMIGGLWPVDRQHTALCDSFHLYLMGGLWPVGRQHTALPMNTFVFPPFPTESMYCILYSIDLDLS